MYAIFVTIKIKPGFADKFKEASLGDAQGSVRDEPGCVRFDMHQSTTDPNTFHLYEVYENQDAHQNAHRNAPHLAAYRERREKNGLTAGAVEMEIYRSLAD